jgi:hypothetical protein
MIFFGSNLVSRVEGEGRGMGRGMSRGDGREYKFVPWDGREYKFVRGWEGV